MLAVVVMPCLAQKDRVDRFEAASIRTVDASAPLGFIGGPGSADPDRIVWSRASVTQIIGSAYSGSRVAAPADLDSEWYSITATLPKDSTRDQMQNMFRAMLEERFGLVVHHETTQVSVYEMTLAQPGVGMKPSGPLGAATSDSLDIKRDNSGFPVLPPGIKWQSSIDNDAIRMTFRNATMDFLASRLAAAYRSATPVVNKTGVTGEFDFRLELPAPAEDNLLSGAGALKKQIGVQLQKGSDAYDYVVVDRINKAPTPN